MRRSIKYFLLGVLSVLLFMVGCRKRLPGNDIERADLISQAHTFVDSLNTTGYSVTYRAAQPKTIRWDLAQLVPVGLAQGLLVPIVFDSALLVKANFVGDQLFHIDYLTQLLFYKDSPAKTPPRSSPPSPTPTTSKTLPVPSPE